MPTPRPETTRLSNRLFNYRWLALITVVFLAMVFGLHWTALRVCAIAPFDCPASWPISVFHYLGPTPQRLLTAAAVLLTFFLFTIWLERVEYRLTHVILAGILLIVGSNLIQGWSIGLYAPISGSAYTGELVPVAAEGQEYYHDVLRIDDPSALFLNYNQEQHSLNQHSYTHPPGAILLFYILLKLLRHPGLVALFIAIVAASSSAFLVHRLLITELEPRVARYATFLFLLLPAIQIYYLATLDALIASALLGTLYCFRRADESKYLCFAAILLIASFALTFVSLFILPVLVMFDLIDRRNLRRSAVVIGCMIAFYLGMYFLFGYNAWQSFRAAAQFENPHGFMLFLDPINYLFTRLEDVFELAVFLGPWLLVLIARGFKEGWADRSRLYTLALLGIGTLLAMFVTGAFRTGETARAAMFIFPYFLIPIALVLSSVRPNRTMRLQLASLVFGHAVLMQVIGNYFY
jgi:hypothetical protein